MESSWLAWRLPAWPWHKTRRKRRQFRRGGQRDRGHRERHAHAEITVQRALRRVPPEKHAEARKEILDMLIDNSFGRTVSVQQKASWTRRKSRRASPSSRPNAKAEKRHATMMREMNLSDEEMRYQVAPDLRWEKFSNSKATNPRSRTCSKEPSMFDGSKVRHATS